MFPFGVGTAVNRYLINGIAKAGGGKLTSCIRKGLYLEKPVQLRLDCERIKLAEPKWSQYGLRIYKRDGDTIYGTAKIGDVERLCLLPEVRMIGLVSN